MKAAFSGFYNKFRGNNSQGDSQIVIPNETDYKKMRDDYGEFAMYFSIDVYNIHNALMAYTLGQLNCINDSLTPHGKKVLKVTILNHSEPRWNNIYLTENKDDKAVINFAINNFVHYTVANDKPLSVHDKAGQIIGRDVNRLLYLHSISETEQSYNIRDVDIAAGSHFKSTTPSGYYISTNVFDPEESEETNIEEVMRSGAFDLLPSSIAYIYRHYFILKDHSEHEIMHIQKCLQAVRYSFCADYKFSEYLKTFNISNGIRSFQGDILSSFVYEGQNENRISGLTELSGYEDVDKDYSEDPSQYIMRQMLFSSNLDGDDNGENVSIIENTYFGDNASPFLPFLVPFEDVQKNLVSTGVYRNDVGNNNNGSVHGSGNSGHSVHNAYQHGSPTKYANQSTSYGNHNPFDDENPWVNQPQSTDKFSQNFDYNATPSATNHKSLRPETQNVGHYGQRANHFGDAPISNAPSQQPVIQLYPPQQASNAPSQQPVIQLDTPQQDSNHPSQIPVIQQINPQRQSTSYNASPIVPHRDQTSLSNSSINLGNAFSQQHNTQHSQAYVNNPIQPRHVNYKNLPSSNNYNYSVNLGSGYSPIQAARTYGQPQLHSNRPIYQDVSREGYEPSERIYRGYYFDNPLPPISNHAVKIQENHVIKHARPKVRGMH